MISRQHKKMSRTLQTLLLAAASLSSACAAMHAQAVTNMRNNGEHAKADCYEKCAPDDIGCTTQCDNAHPRTLTAEQQQLITGAVLADAAKKDQANSTAGAPPPGNDATGGAHSSGTSQRTLTINGTSYTGGADLGKPCSLDSPCPAGYTCHLVTDRSGQCVQ